MRFVVTLTALYFDRVCFVFGHEFAHAFAIMSQTFAPIALFTLGKELWSVLRNPPDSMTVATVV